jgi:hypothetical protein
VEICNGVDDDCDGAIDEGSRNACGACGPIPEEICDLVDNDCDGNVDEECTGGATTEVEPNDGAMFCQPIALPPQGDANVFEGVLDPAGDTDSYCFFVRAGTRLRFDIDAQVLGSPVDGVLELFAADGQAIDGGYNDYADGPDPAMDLEFDEDMELRLEVRDFYPSAGGPSYDYHLRVEALARPTCDDLDNDGLSACDGDCDEADHMVFPGQTEVCDGIDNDCDGEPDNDCPNLARPELEPNDLLTDCPVLTLPFLVEGAIAERKDKDTFCFFVPQDTEVAFDVDAAEPPFGSLLNSRIKLMDVTGEEIERNDDGTDPETGYEEEDSDSFLQHFFLHPGVYALQVSDESTWAGGSRLTYRLNAVALSAMACVDADGDGVSTCEGDCDDTNSAVHFGAPEICDGVDNDCNGLGDPGTCTGDFDGDGYAGADGDCDDDDPTRHPGRAEVCDLIDNNCDGVADEGTQNACGGCGHAPAEICGDQVDNDCDGVIDDDCLEDLDGDGLTPDDGDCDDSRADVRPGAEEGCDGVDNNCDGLVDEFVKNSCGLCAAEPVELCDGLDNNCNGLVDDGALNACGTCGPTPVEVCDGIDNDCDGEADEGLLNACGGCGPVPAEVCDGFDNDCDGDVDEGCDADLDNDGVSPRQGDCDDGLGTRHWGATELCDGIDNDCDGTVDDGCPTPTEGEPNDLLSDCRALNWPGEVLGTISSAGDSDWFCVEVTVPDTQLGFDVDARDDGSPLDAHLEVYSANGALLEQNNNVASDPDTGAYTVDPYVSYTFANPGTYALRLRAAGTGSSAGPGASYRVQLRAEGGCLDLDGDGITVCDGDCDDENASRQPGAVDVCDGQDNNCADGVDERCFGDCLDDLLEPNDTAGGASTLSAGSYDELAFCGLNGADYFRVLVGGGGALRATILFDGAGANLSLELRGSDGVTILESSQGSGNSEVVERTGLAAGDYYLHIYGPVGGESDYSLDLEVTP